MYQEKKKGPTIFDRTRKIVTGFSAAFCNFLARQPARVRICRETLPVIGYFFGCPPLRSAEAVLIAALEPEGNLTLSLNPATLGTRQEFKRARLSLARIRPYATRNLETPHLRGADVARDR